MAILAACTKGPPACGDEAVISTLKKRITETIATTRHAAPDDVMIWLDAITTIRTDGKINQCEADASFSLKSFDRPGEPPSKNPLGRIQYRAFRTDDGQPYASLGP